MWNEGILTIQEKNLCILALLYRIRQSFIQTVVTNCHCLSLGIYSGSIYDTY